MRCSVLALALPLVAALPSFPPGNDPAAGGGVAKRWKFNPDKDSNIEVTAADVEMYKKMGWTPEQIKQLDPEAPVGTQPDREVPEGGSPFPPRGGPPDQHAGSPSPEPSVDSRVSGDEGPGPLNSGPDPLNSGLNPLNSGLNPLNDDLDPLNDGLDPLNDGLDPLNDGTQQRAQSRPTRTVGNDGPEELGSGEDGLDDFPIAAPRPTGQGNDGQDNSDSDNSGGSSGRVDDWLAIANEIRQSLNIPNRPPLPILTRDSKLEAAARARSAASVRQNPQELTHTPQGQLLGPEVMHFGKANEFRDVVWGWLCEMPEDLGITKQCEGVKNTRKDTKDHAKYFTDPAAAAMGCGHQESDYFGGQWTCTMDKATPPSG